jgi:peptidoglycan/xylan/chitin deacetylase (PgdA/CDA1 family)
MENTLLCFPGGRFKALTLSYDDGKDQDRRLVGILNRHGLKASFHLNSGALDSPGAVSASEVAELYRGHEVACHTRSHPTLARCPEVEVLNQILDDRKTLEGLVGYPVRGFSYPNGSYSAGIMEALPRLGIEYARVVPTTGGFGLPENLHEWRGTCHHNDGLMARAGEFLGFSKSQYLYLMYVWGHSYEFDRDGTWPLIEAFAAGMDGRDDVWFATNIEIVDYLNRWKGMRFSADCALAHNPAALPVWMRVGERIVEVGGGQTASLRP